ncbi:c-type cytochrome [Thalassovita sp.]|jgi:mono/diheme cytochrome c family protein|uniref:c-type cytochrome n=1 Tax=Thalassovita sp. TaxID=1979401 RepID=UPI003B58BE6B
MRWIIGLLLLAAAGWFLTAPSHVDTQQYGSLQGSADRGETVFHAAGCASCHTAPDAEDSDRPILSGGRAFASEFGTFYAPNISPDPTQGIGDWSLPEMADALVHGTSPDGRHYYPALPYTTYAKAAPQDIADLFAFLMTLPKDATPNRAHEVGFPFNIRRSLGGWKLLFASDDWMTDAPSEQLQRGRYLVEALAHCGECHTPRNALGGMDRAKWLQGAPNPSGRGKIPDLTTLDWSQDDLVEYLTSGFTPDFDSAGGEMAEVVQNMARLPLSDREAIAAYLIALR